MIVYNISSYNRPRGLINAVKSVINQCDVINVALNSYANIPRELYNSKINILLTDNEKGDAYKFYWLEKSSEYYFTIDDDFIYPPDYTNFMISGVERYKRQSIVTMHGRSFTSFPIDSYYKRDCVQCHYRDELKDDTKIQFGGTGVMCFHTETVKIPFSYFAHPNMADVWVGKYAKENNVDIICLKHNANYLTDQLMETSIFSKHADKKNDQIQTNLVNMAFKKETIR